MDKARVLFVIVLPSDDENEATAYRNEYSMSPVDVAKFVEFVDSLPSAERGVETPDVQA